jgi:hypothetical protein
MVDRPVFNEMAHAFLFLDYRRLIPIQIGKGRTLCREKRQLANLWWATQLSFLIAQAGTRHSTLRLEFPMRRMLAKRLGA